MHAATPTRGYTASQHRVGYTCFPDLQAALAKQQAAQTHVELTHVTSDAGMQQATAGVEWAKAAVQTARAQVVTARSRPISSPISRSLSGSGISCPFCCSWVWGCPVCLCP